MYFTSLSGSRGTLSGRCTWPSSLAISSQSPVQALLYPALTRLSSISVGSGLTFCSSYSLVQLIGIPSFSYHTHSDSLISMCSPGFFWGPRFLHPKCLTPLFDASCHIRLCRIALSSSDNETPVAALYLCECPHTIQKLPFLLIKTIVFLHFLYHFLNSASCYFSQFYCNVLPCVDF